MAYADTDIDFELSAGSSTYASRLARMSVLYSLTKPCRNPSQVVASTRRLIDLYRLRLHVLDKHGWEPSCVGGFESLRNCQPAFVYVKPAAWSCRLRHICPFCYARQVIEAWERVDRALQYKKTSSGHQRTPYRVVARTVAFTRRFRPKEGIDEGAYLQHLIQGSIAYRPRVIRGVNPLGAYMYLTVAPSRKGWRFRNRQLFLLAADQDFPEALRGTIRQYDQPTREEMLKVMAKLWRYPQQLIMGDSGRTAQMLAVRQSHKTRLTATYRCLRKNL